MRTPMNRRDRSLENCVAASRCTACARLLRKERGLAGVNASSSDEEPAPGTSQRSSLDQQSQAAAIAAKMLKSQDPSETQAPLGATPPQVSTSEQADMARLIAQELFRLQQEQQPASVTVPTPMPAAPPVTPPAPRRIAWDLAAEGDKTAWRVAQSSGLHPKRPSQQLKMANDAARRRHLRIRFTWIAVGVVVVVATVVVFLNRYELFSPGSYKLGYETGKQAYTEFGGSGAAGNCSDLVRVAIYPGELNDAAFMQGCNDGVADAGGP